MLKADVQVPMTQENHEEKQPENHPPKAERRSWLWPLGVAATGLAGLAVVLMRGCWHRKMSWPVRIEGYSYQVCLSCGVKRLFDERNFGSYGPFSYDLRELVAWERARSRPQEAVPPREERRPAS